ncbi:UNVERIFIED_CONTAM: hypothetical protein GTU68_051084 [Idotea baltica]|nr:hypothetical protein [Idotea baltica]
MAGFPIAVIDTYLERLVDQGLSVALISQKVGSSKKIDRFLERILTPGIRLLSNSESNSDKPIAVIYPSSKSVKTDLIKEFVIAYSNVQTCRVQIKEIDSLSNLIREIQKINPIEIILPSEVNDHKLDKKLKWIQELERISNLTLKFHKFSDSLRKFNQINGYQSLTEKGRKAFKTLVDYIDEVTVGNLIPIEEVSLANDSSFLNIDAGTRKNLDLVENCKDGSLDGTLFKYLDYTKTISGKRLLKNWILYPLINLEEIKKRQEVISYFKSSQSLGNIKASLKYVPDLERISLRVQLSLVLPRELSSLAFVLSRIPEIKNNLNNDISQLKKINDNLSFTPKLKEILDQSLLDKPAISLKSGGVINDSYNKELDDLREIRSKGKTWITEVEAREKEATGITSLKIKFNNVHGYFFEVTKANIAKVPENYVKKQTTVNSERFITEELKELEKNILSAEFKQISLEKKLYTELLEELLPYSDEIRKISEALSLLDVYCSLGSLANLKDLVCPEVYEDERLEIENGAHPILLDLLQQDFIRNSLSLTSQKVGILTGPNMGGKSTYLRQSALIVILTQIGSFVPASKAEIGIVDQVFARIGASDDQLEGDSTFMVEMREASHIISNASFKSLLVVDELGRGTTTADGTSIARAVLENIVKEIKSRTLFATHYHELCDLEEEYKDIFNLSVGAKDTNGKVIFSHKIEKGPASRSYGIEVAKLAGLPSSILNRAKSLLELYSLPKNNSQLNFFSKIKEVEVEKVEPKDYQELKQLKKLILDLDSNNLTPIEALTHLSKIQKDIKND